MSNSVTEEIKKWVVNDYFTPNIKAEVILDTLLTPCIASIVKAQCSDVGKELEFVTKEMSIAEIIPDQEEREKYGNRGTKIDYILADNSHVYIVELKTTSSSISDEQLDKYIKNCAEKTFEDVFGNKLVSIMALKGSKERVEGKEELRNLFQDWCEKYKYECPERGYAYHAQKLLKENGLDSTKKYLYTIGQILDYLDKYGKEVKDIWKKKLRLIYITPYGEEILSQNKQEKEWKSFYIKPDKSESVSIKRWATEKEENEVYGKEYNEDYVKFLKDIIKELYLE